MNLIQKLEQEEIKRLAKNVPGFSPGDTVVVNVNVVEGDRKRAQAFEVRSQPAYQHIDDIGERQRPTVSPIEFRREGVGANQALGRQPGAA